MSVILGLIQFFIWPAIISRESELLIFTLLIVLVMIFCSLISVSEQYFVVFYGLTDYRMVRYESCDRAALPLRVISTQSHFGGGLLIGPNQFVFTGASRANLHSLAIILTLALVSKLKGLSANTSITILPESVTLKRIARECQNLKKCEYRNQTNCHEYNKQKYCQGV